MPIYIYKNESTGEIKEVFQGMNDEHRYEEDGVEWKRVFLKPNASIDTKVDPNNNVSFIEKTGKMKGTVGDMMDLSTELSEKRAEKHDGKDPVKQKFFDNYEKNVGKKHLADKPKTIETSKYKIDL